MEADSLIRLRHATRCGTISPEATGALRKKGKKGEKGKKGKGQFAGRVFFLHGARAARCRLSRGADEGAAHSQAGEGAAVVLFIADGASPYAALEPRFDLSMICRSAFSENAEGK